MPAFFISSAEIHGTALTLTGELCHHLRASLRVKPGEVLRLTDEHRQRYEVRVSAVAPQALTAEILESRPGPIDTSPRVILAQVILKGDHMDWVVQKASELGVKAVLPLISRHGVVRPQPERVAAQVARWQRIATEAAQQSEQWQPPQVLEPLEVRRFFSGHQATTALLLAERQNAVGLANVPLPALPTDTITVIVGPEGGWAEEELSQAMDGQCLAVSLGEHILRADTAAVTALSIVQSRLGRLG
ncbi:MAG TPA: RsmE family RNA methyltransferase [Nitrospira sp.]|nr:16S rRNA (uracil(1498)-N(3))-methyltransferase [Nitrospira sp.]MBX3369857.1 16S rRNA (uracil(1498)-N(3))-methyltransferase [Nitrospira sp.]MBX7038704.1 16S rRNA (uracil(1498)-N(3))-methyltransferase [Nitrospira sp.]MCW5793460.1 16S rRNA (uracil(1498)-N(3))-methyltransferase [Nitrospira sp.]HMU30447.1 RsmE family RNA methyltransferase [Nitrospira sp.]